MVRKSILCSNKFQKQIKKSLDKHSWLENDSSKSQNQQKKHRKYSKFYHENSQVKETQHHAIQTLNDNEMNGENVALGEPKSTVH